MTKDEALLMYPSSRYPTTRPSNTFVRSCPAPYVFILRISDWLNETKNERASRLKAENFQTLSASDKRADEYQSIPFWLIDPTGGQVDIFQLR